MQFLANKLPYLRNSARYDQGYYDGLVGSRICAFDWYLEQPISTLLQQRCFF